FFPTLPASIPIETTATDDDGSIRQVELWLDATLLGTRSEAPYSWTWTNATPGSHVLVAVAQDNQDARTSSAPVRIIVTTPPQPVPLTINASGTNLTVSWPVSTVALSLQSTSNLALNSGWSIDTNPPALQDNRYIVSVADHDPPRFFRLGPEISPSTLEHKHLLGYQGWFGCPGDGSPVNQWIHWFRRGVPVATNATVDFWPDIRELSDEELYPTTMTLKDGSQARVYSAYNPKTVTRHFQWMKEHHLDGVFLQRFSSELSSPAFFALRNQVTENVRAGAESQGRVFAIMYDISGQPASTVVSALTNDWRYLTGTLHLTNSPVYIQHHGKPVVAIWGFGFTDRAGTPEEAMTVIQFFKDAGCTVMGGVPTYWRTLTQDSRTNAAWAAVYRSFDIVSPWAVGRYGTVAEADTFKRNLIAPDLAETRKRGIDYMPVIFPGFSWHNLNGGKLNQIPRNGGAFYWRQAYNAVTAGCTMMYGAMFDEMDEGTAMLKMASTANELPQQGAFVPLNIDGQNLPSDWYLRLADEATKMLRGDIPAKPQMPITPP
ncbi:MAG TPA: Ig-like domain-containing protein, partial [Candidatus Limnocylindria bacterium]|nr:Ig-like domain-containing protein [Candidatus Limnocylindria bacterium]